MSKGCEHADGSDTDRTQTPHETCSPTIRVSHACVGHAHVHIAGTYHTFHMLIILVLDFCHSSSLKNMFCFISAFLQSEVDVGSTPVRRSKIRASSVQMIVQTARIPIMLVSL